MPAKPSLPPPLFPRNKNSNRPESKVAVVRKMLTLSPYNRLPLHVRLFSSTASRDWNAAGDKPGVGPLNQGTTVETTFGGVDGKRVVGGRMLGEGNPIEVDDCESDLSRPGARFWLTGFCVLIIKDAFAAAHYLIYASFIDSLPSSPPSTHDCPLCPSPVDLAEPLSHAFCPTCHTTSHLTCLSSHFLRRATDQSSVLPTWGTCAGSCGWEGEWGQVIRGCWAVKRGRDGTLEDGRKKGRGGKRKAGGQDEEDDDGGDEDEDEDGPVAQAADEVGGREILVSMALPHSAPHLASLMQPDLVSFASSSLDLRLLLPSGPSRTCSRRSLSKRRLNVHD